MDIEEVLRQTQLLHMLANEPDSVIPPGKSLLSMMTDSRLEPNSLEPTAILHDRVEQAIHGAFWNQALESLSDPTPSVQLARLKGLLSDVREAISPLFPTNHPVIATLSVPVPPTASPLISTKLHFKDILLSCRERAAPVRDAEIDGLLADLDAPLSPITPSSPSSLVTSTSQLALLIINTAKSIIALAERMKADLNQFVLGSMTDTELRDVVVQQAKKREKELVLDIWGKSDHDGRQRVYALWQTWVNELEEQQMFEIQPKDRWICRLVQSLGSTKGVSCTIPDLVTGDDPVSEGNQLPPQFYFAAPRLFYVQNYLQALVVAASLRSLTRLPLASDSRGPNFMERVWTLLKAQIDETNTSAAPTNVINFADEVVRARRLVSAPDEHEEAQLRAAVDRTLQERDPVFLLLQKRLFVALARRLCELRLHTNVESPQAPERMQTGRTVGSERAGKRPRVEEEVSSASPGKTIVKGFEDPVLVRAISDVLRKVYQHIRWIELVWKDDGIL